MFTVCPPLLFEGSNSECCWRSSNERRITSTYHEQMGDGIWKRQLRQLMTIYPRGSSPFLSSFGHTFNSVVKSDHDRAMMDEVFKPTLSTIDDPLELERQASKCGGPKPKSRRFLKARYIHRSL